MKIQTALKDLSYQIIWGEADQEVKEVIYDSRKAEPETVFVCMMGARIDSHDFMQEVAEKGCRLFVVEKEIPEALFCRCHKSFIVNINYVKMFKYNEFLMSDGNTIPVGRNYREKVKQCQITMELL